jgi:uncharacterized protein YicC (UPF0701 family)
MKDLPPAVAVLLSVGDPTAGALGLVMQGGALVLLAYWLIFDNPKARKEASDERLAERERFAGVIRQLSEMYQTEAREMRAVLIQSLQGMRTAVHDVKDTAQQAMNKAAIQKREGGQ